jgi:hypothetical protein
MPDGQRMMQERKQPKLDGILVTTPTFSRFAGKMVSLHQYPQFQDILHPGRNIRVLL